jgi:hypothetical protein
VEAAAEIRGYYNNAKLCYLQIGKKLTEIKDQFEHGEWQNFIETNTDMSIRGAQQCMQAYQEYGFDTRYIEIGSSKGIQLLPMPKEEREKLMAENDVKGMSVRELKKKIQEMREAERERTREAVEAERESGRIQLAKMKEQAEAEKQAAVTQAEEAAKETVNQAWRDARAKIDEAMARADKAEKMAFDAETRPPEVVRETVADPALVAELQKTKEEIERLAEANRAMMENQKTWSQEKARMQAELEENEALIQEQQEINNSLDSELSALKSAQRRGEDPAGEGMNLDTFQRITREFMGWVISFPQMQGTFSQMTEKERRKWREQVETVRAWAMDTLKALDCLNAAEGGYSIE